MKRMFILWCVTLVMAIVIIVSQGACQVSSGEAERSNSVVNDDNIQGNGNTEDEFNETSTEVDSAEKQLREQEGEQKGNHTLDKERIYINEPASRATLRFFRIVNQAGTDIEVRAVANGQELFVREIESGEGSSNGVREWPPQKFPAEDVKVEISEATKIVRIEESNLGLTKKFDISGFSKSDAGFSITITAEGIHLSQDYYPIR